MQAHRPGGQLVAVLEDWTVTHAGFYLYYASRRRQPPALAALIEWLRRTTLPARSGEPQG